MNPTLIVMTTSACGILVSDYLTTCMYHLPYLVSEIRVCPEMLHVFQYKLHAHTRELHLHSTEQQGRLELFIEC